MQPKQLATQIIQFNRNLVDRTFESADLMQAQVEKMTDLCLSLNPWLPEGGRDMIAEWQNGCRTGMTAWRDSLNAGLAQADRLWQTENEPAPEA
jgi:hypothetical protein